MNNYDKTFVYDERPSFESYNSMNMQYPSMPMMPVYPGNMMMPNMNGWDAARKIRSMKRRDAGTIPIIAMSANAFTDDIEKSHAAGMNAHLVKPLDMEKLKETIGLFCERQEIGA